MKIGDLYRINKEKAGIFRITPLKKEDPRTNRDNFYKKLRRDIGLSDKPKE